MNKTKPEAAPTEKPKPEAFSKEKTGVDVALIDQWLAEHYQGPEDTLGRESFLAQLAKAVVERALAVEGGNCRNGTIAKSLLGEGAAAGWRGGAVPDSAAFER